MSHAIRKRYDVITASLGTQDRAEVDRIATLLKDVGWPHSNRSLVLREGVRWLVDTLRGKSTEEVFRFFVDRQRLRAQPNVRPPSAA
jgi:hypothetical protein